MIAAGSSGWQAPEQLGPRDETTAPRLGRSVDVFAYGLVLHFCLTGGRHAFGQQLERDYNILHVRRQPCMCCQLSPVAQRSNALTQSHDLACCTLPVMRTLWIGCDQAVVAMLSIQL